jgi:hypothetical protein
MHYRTIDDLAYFKGVFAFNTVVVPSSETNSIFTSVASVIVTDFHFRKITTFHRYNLSFDSDDHAPIEWGLL